MTATASLTERHTAREACMTALRPADGVRRTWQRMLEPGTTGSGIMPWVSNIGWWSEVYGVDSITLNSPILTPAFVEWSAPTLADTEHFDSPVPFVVARRIEFVGSNRTERSELLGLNVMSCEICEDFTDEDIPLHGVAVPLWSVNPIESHLVDDWRHDATKHWDAHWELDLIDGLNGDGTGHWPVVREDDEDSECGADAYGGDGSDCDCGYEDSASLLRANMEAGVYMPSLEGFVPSWERTVGRWTIGWFEINRIGGIECLSSLVQQLSPFYRR